MSALVSHLGVVTIGLLSADEAVAVGVDAAELLARAEKFAARHVAIAVSVHLAEPERPGRGFLGRRRRRRTYAAGRFQSKHLQKSCVLQRRKPAELARAVPQHQT